MSKLRISVVGNKNLKQHEAVLAKESFHKHIPEIELIQTDENPELILFATGGSELQAKHLLKDNKFYILLADNKENSYAAATEVKAYANEMNIDTKLINFSDQISTDYIRDYYFIKKLLHKLKGKTVGLIGQSSEWLIASDTDPAHLYNRFGITTKTVEWDTLEDYKKIKINQTFNEVFESAENDKLADSERVYELIKKTIYHNNWDAVTVECFPLVREHKVTACLALAKLNDDGIAAGCEGDIPSIIGMMITKELTGSVAWMANTASLTGEHVLFAHCTIAPGLINNMNLMSHYETDEGLSVQGEFIEEDITVFRFNNSFSKIFISEGTVINHPKYHTACRTQIEVKLPKKDLKKLKENPLGNHHIIIPGHWASKLKLIAKVKNIEII
jgi:L-fucose isomerase-like protein